MNTQKIISLVILCIASAAYAMDRFKDEQVIIKINGKQIDTRLLTDTTLDEIVATYRVINDLETLKIMGGTEQNKDGSYNVEQLQTCIEEQANRQNVHVDLVKLKAKKINLDEKGQNK